MPFPIPHPYARRARSQARALCVSLCLLAQTSAAEPPAEPVAPAAEPVAPAAVVSATAGEWSGALTRGSKVEEGQPVSTGAAENMALVLQDDALLELCARSVVTLKRHAVRKAQIVKLDAGEARFVVSPRSPDERIEVHTPSAIATILGTIVLVKVDPDTGETTVSSEENAVEVKSSDPNVSGSTRVARGEQCVVATGMAPSRARVLPEAVFATLGECLMDLENAALAQDRIARRRKDLERIAMADSSLFDLPGVAGVATPEFAMTDVGTGFWPASPDDVLDPTSEASSNPSFGVIVRPDPIPPPCTAGACTPGFP